MLKKRIKLAEFSKLSTVLITMLITPIIAKAQTSLEKPNLQVPSLIAPDYFGPNAFPVADILDGRTSKEFRVELSADYFLGHRGDKTQDIALKAIFPLWSERVNLVVWFSSICEWYQMSDLSHQHSRLGEDIAKNGYEFGDAYLSTDLHLLKETKKRPDITLRIALKSALGYGFFKARYYDGPGYFFDSSIAKSLKFESPFVKELRFVVSGGFLCWQTDNGRQNDAIMYGLQAKLDTKLFAISQTWGGYNGWERVGDLPMTLKSEVRFHCNKLEPLALFQYGLRDYPFTQFKVGMAYIF